MKKEIKLNVAISLLVILVVFLATLINLFSSTNALRQSLTDNYLESNNNYSLKLAEATDYIVDNLQLSIVTMANLASETEFTQKHLDIIFESEKIHFNSVFVTDQDGVIQLISPNIIEFEDNVIVKAGTVIDSKIVNRASTEGKPFISEAYKTTSGTLLFLVTAPIFDEHENFKGVTVGTVYLEDKNVINIALGKHGHNDGSFVYAVDHDGHIIYHPDEEKIFEDVSNDPIVQKLASGESGFEKVKGEEGQEYFAGFTYINNLGWGIISLTPTTTISEPMNNLLVVIITRTITMLVLLLLIATFLVKRLTKPLTQLAEYSEKSILNKELNNPIELKDINSHIYEINQLNRQVKSHLMMLNKEIQLDGLTGLANRRAFDATISEKIESKQPFSLILFDIDNFKQVNDTYGHLVGDDVIKYLASIISDLTQKEDFCFRYGGEEFGILVDGKNESDAWNIAEQVRRKVSETISPTGQPITISLGISSFNGSDVYASTVIDRADKALYESKKNGKNRTTIFKENM